MNEKKDQEVSSNGVKTYIKSKKAVLGSTLPSSSRPEGKKRDHSYTLHARAKYEIDESLDKLIARDVANRSRTV